jgi:hypothetical protein
MVALEVARRTTNHKRLHAALAARGGHSGSGRAWKPETVARGDAGLALICGHLDRCRPGEGWDIAAHGFMTSAVRAAERLPHLGPGLFGGLSGLAFVATTLAGDGGQYQRLFAALEGAVLARAEVMLDAVRSRAMGAHPGQIDVISGLSGIGAGLLGRRRHDALVSRILAALVELTGSRAGVPRWHTPPIAISDEGTAPFPRGKLDLGLAHGIPGPMALLALTLRHGIEVARQREALRRTCDWLLKRRWDDGWGVGWPPVAPVGVVKGTGLAGTGRTAWCYGTPGVARVLWLCGEALDDPGLRSVALEAMSAVYRRPVAARGIDSPTFCHGVAGLLQITLRFAHDTGLPMFSEAATALATQLLDAYEPNGCLGFRALVAGDRRVEDPGVLDGSAGVVLVLLAAATDVEPTWDRLFMLA